MVLGFCGSYRYAEAVRLIPSTPFKAPRPEANRAGEQKSDDLKSEGGGGAPSDDEEEAGPPVMTVMVSSMGPGIFVEDACSICLCTFESGDGEEGTVKVLNCGHGYHPACLDEWLFRRNVCPLCKVQAVNYCQ